MSCMKTNRLLELSDFSIMSITQIKSNIVRTSRNDQRALIRAFVLKCAQWARV
jgi:hypothetical protein